MKDIERMRREFERKIKLAEMSNEVEQKVGIECTVMGESCTQKGKTWISFGKIKKEQAAKVLKMFPLTERSITRSRREQDIEINYVLNTSRGPKDIWTKLDIEWISGEYCITLSIELSNEVGDLLEYFKKDWYEIDESTIGLYFGAVSPSERDSLRRVFCLSFNCGDVVRFYGGHFKQVSEGHADCIIAEIIGE